MDNQGGVAEKPVGTFEVMSISDMLVKRVGRSGIIYLPLDWADMEVVVIRRKKD